MNLFKNRTRLVSFRVTPDELENLRLACLLKGARNVSDFARNAVLEHTGPRAIQDEHLLGRFSALELKLSEIQSTLHQNELMLRALARALASHGPDKAQGKGV
jgi:hypothetical protein